MCYSKVVRCSFSLCFVHENLSMRTFVTSFAAVARNVAVLLKV